MRRIVILAPAITAIMLAASFNAFAAGKPQVNVYPSQKASFLAGQKFDLRVEAENLSKANLQIKVTINGKDVSDFFSKQASPIKTEDGKASVTLRDISIKEPGNYKVAATVVDGTEITTGQVDWTVEGVSKYGPKAKNVILFIGDGMSLPTRTAARILSKGFEGGKAKDVLNMEKMDEFGFILTNSLDTLATDSANSASAYATGHKTSVNAMGVYPDNTPDPFDNPKVETIVELAKRTRGLATGLVTTADITDATPAAMFAHTRLRSESIGIVDQMLSSNQRPDVIMGGGSQWFIPKSAVGSKRKDDRDVIGEFEKLGYTFTETKSDLSKVDASKTDKLLGFYNLGNMNYYIDREMLKGKDLGAFTDQPTLPQMTQKAIDILSKNENGFFLMVEGACVDKALHPMDWERAVYDAIELDQAVGVAQKFAAKDADTLIIVTADHSHSLSITGTYHELDGKTGREAVRVYQNSVYPTFEDKDGDGFPDNPAPSVTLAVGYGNHPDYTEDYKFNPVFLNPAVVSANKAIPNPVRDPKGELQIGNLPYSETQEVHTVEDVPVTSAGPGSANLRGVIDNTRVFFAIAQALDLNATK